MITIIIPVFNNVQLTKNCLESIYDNTPSESFNLLVIDNASTDQTPEYLARFAKSNFSFLRNETNLGFAKANNQGSRLATSEKLLFLNNDTLVTSGWLKELDEELSQNGNKLTSPKLLYPDQTIQHAGMVFSESKNQFGQNIIYHLYRNFPQDHLAVNKKRNFQAVTGACMLIERDYFLALGGFAENYLNGFEDVDLCLKIREAGGKITYCPKSVVYHLEGKTPGRFNNTVENTNFFFSRWGKKIIPDEKFYYQQDGFVLLHTEQKWIDSDFFEQNGEKLTIKTEKLNVIFQKSGKDPKLTVFIKNIPGSDLLAFIMKLPILIDQSYKIMICGLKEKIPELDYFENLGWINETNSGSLLKEISENDSSESFVFLSTDQEINPKFFAKKDLTDIFARLSTDEITTNPDFWDCLTPFLTRDSDFLIKKTEYLLYREKPLAAIETIKTYISFFGKKAEITNLLIEALEKLGDYQTAEKLKQGKS